MIDLRHATLSEDVPEGARLPKEAWDEGHVIEMAGQRLLGRSAAGEGVAEEIQIGAGLVFDGTTLKTSGSVPTIGSVGSVVLAGVMDTVLNTDYPIGHTVPGSSLRLAGQYGAASVAISLGSIVYSNNPASLFIETATNVNPNFTGTWESLGPYRRATNSFMPTSLFRRIV